MASRPSTLGELEKAAYRSRWQDGLLDLLGGLGVVFVGISWLLDLAWATGFMVPILLVTWMGLRRSVVEPRIGRVTFTEARQKSEQSGTLGTVLLGLGLLLVFIVGHLFITRSEGGFEAWAAAWSAAIPVTLLAIMALTAAALTGLVRFLGYGALFLATGSITTPLGMEPPGQILAAGTIITLVGLAIFVRFLSSHPVLDDLGEAS